MINDPVLLKEFLEEKASQYNRPEFIDSDPIQIPHQFSKKEDIEISGFLAATIAWGNRTSIINDAKRMLSFMGNSPYDFVMHHQNHHLEKIEGSIHRTFHATDLIYFIKALRHLYKTRNGLEGIFAEFRTEESLQNAIHKFKHGFFELPHPARTTKHISDPAKGSAAKRMNLFLRWMVRKDNRGVDFGLWNSVSPSVLSCPLDLHSGNTARKMGLVTRRQNDALTVEELDKKLRQFDPRDPVKYDFALFGLGAFEGF